MKKKYSLKRNEEIAKIVKTVKPIRNDVYNFYFTKNNYGFARICISVSKKNGIAVVRNKIKRQVREIITDIFDFHQGYDCIVVCKNQFLSNTFDTNYHKLEELYLKTKSINKE